MTHQTRKRFLGFSYFYSEPRGGKDREIEFDIPFLREGWAAIELGSNVYFRFSIHEIYDVRIEHQGVLGPTDSRTVLEFGFRVPFRREVV